MKRTWTCAGFSIVETLVALAVIGIGLSAVFSLLIRSNNAVHRTEMLARSALEASSIRVDARLRKPVDQASEGKHSSSGFHVTFDDSSPPLPGKPDVLAMKLRYRNEFTRTYYFVRDALDGFDVEEGSR